MHLLSNKSILILLSISVSTLSINNSIFEVCQRATQINGFFKLQNGTIYVLSRSRIGQEMNTDLFSATIDENKEIDFGSYKSGEYFIPSICEPTNQRRFEHLVSSVDDNGTLEIGCRDSSDAQGKYKFTKYVIIGNQFMQEEYPQTSDSSDSQSFQNYPFIKVYKKVITESSKYIIKTLTYIECDSKLCPLVFKGHDSNIPPFEVILYDSEGNQKASKEIPILPDAVLVNDMKETTNDDSNEKTIDLYISSEYFFASYELVISENMVTNNTLIAKFEQKSNNKMNTIWFGCEPQNSCYGSNIRAVILLDHLYAIRHKSFEKWDQQTWVTDMGNHRGFWIDSYELHSDYRNIDAVFVDPKISKPFIIEGEDILSLSGIQAFNQSFTGERTKVSDKFPEFSGKVNAITFDSKTDEIHLFSNDMFWVYSRGSGDGFVFKSKSKLSEHNLPNDLDAVFIDENGDEIYIKSNSLFWKEYGIIRKQYVQQFCNCSWVTNNRAKPYITNLEEFKAYINTTESIDFTEQLIPKPLSNFVTETTITEEPEVKPNTTRPSITTPSLENTSVEPTPEGWDLELWHLIVLMCLGVLILIGFVVLCYFCGYFCGQKRELTLQERRQLIKERLIKKKEEIQKQKAIHLHEN